MQLDAINSLDRLRTHGEKKALAIAATGSGKTYMAAFDVAEVKPKKLIFGFLMLIEFNYIWISLGGRLQIVVRLKRFGHRLNPHG